MDGPSRSQAVLLAAYVSRLVLGVAVTSVLGRSLDPEEFGFFTLVSTIYLVVPTFLDLGSGMLAVREIAQVPARERSLLEGLMGWRQISGVALAGLVLVMASAESDSTRRFVLLGAAASLLLMAPGALTPVFTLRQAQGGPALVSTLGQCLILAGALALRAAHAPGAEFAWLLVLREVVGVGAGFLLAVRLLGYWPRPGLRGRELGRLLAPAALLGGAVAAHDLYFYADVFLVRLLRGEVELGAYSAALRPLNPLLGLPFLLMLPLLPVFSANAVESHERLANQVAGAAGLLGGIGVLGAAAGIGLAPDLVRILYGGRYATGSLEAVSSFRWLCLALAATSVGAPFVSALLALGRERVLLAVSAMGLVFNVTANLLLVPRYSFTAAALITAITETLVGLAALAALRRSGVGVGLAGALSVPAAFGVGVLALTTALPGSDLARVAVGALVAALGVIYLVSRPSARRLRQELAFSGAGPA